MLLILPSSDGAGLVPGCRSVCRRWVWCEGGEPEHLFWRCGTCLRQLVPVVVNQGPGISGATLIRGAVSSPDTRTAEERRVSFQPL